MDRTGRVFKYGDNVDTDVIIPARYLDTVDKKELAAHCMEGLDADFAKTVRKGDFIVAGRNFGCGSSREHAPSAIRESGISCVIAASFARIFFRNAVNTGLAIMECPEAAERVRVGDELDVDYKTGTVTNRTRGETYSAAPFSDFVQKIIDSGGLLGYVAAALEAENEV